MRFRPPTKTVFLTIVTTFHVQLQLMLDIFAHCKCIEQVMPGLMPSLFKIHSIVSFNAKFNSAIMNNRPWLPMVFQYTLYSKPNIDSIEASKLILNGLL